LIALRIQCCIVGLKVESLKWSSPVEMTKTKINVYASISKAQVFIGFVLFDHRRIKRFRSAKLYTTKKFEVVDAEACDVWEAISHVVQHNYLLVGLSIVDTTREPGMKLNG
jgi:hypothetical protein